VTQREDGGHFSECVFLGLLFFFFFFFIFSFFFIFFFFFFFEEFTFFTILLFESARPSRASVRFLFLLPRF